MISNIELRTSLSLGRKLAHASSESEEFLVSLQKERPRGKDLRKWKGYYEERFSRGLGEIEVIDLSTSKTTVLINRYSSGPMEAGIFTSSWETATGKRHKFRWSESSKVLMVELNEDKLEVPSPRVINGRWPETIEKNDTDGHVDWEDIRELDSGGWELTGERKFILYRDLMLRFEDYSIHNIDTVRDSRIEDYKWIGVEEKRALWWTAVADSSRQLFSDSGRHVMISGAEDWASISIRNLSLNGLGILSNPRLEIETGEINARLLGCFHPAICGGILLGCWERSTGVKGRITMNLESETLGINIVPNRVTINNHE